MQQKRENKQKRSGSPELTAEELNVIDRMGKGEQMGKEHWQSGNWMITGQVLENYGSKCLSGLLWFYMRSYELIGNNMFLLVGF